MHVFVKDSQLRLLIGKYTVGLLAGGVLLSHAHLYVNHLVKYIIKFNLAVKLGYFLSYSEMALSAQN